MNPKSQQATSIVTGIDHVNVATSDPQGLAETLQRVLGLTEAWPFTDYGAFVTVGLMAATSSTIAVDRSDGDVPFLVPHGRSRFSTVVFTPVSTETAVAELDRRNVARSAPRPYPLWTNTLLPGLLGPDDMAFLCEYTSEPWFLEMKAALTRNFLDTAGGPAGVRGLTQIVVESPDVRRTVSRWEQVLGPPTCDSEWTFPEGPAFVIQPGAGDERVRYLVFQIDDLAVTLAAMHEAGIAIDQRGETITIDPATFDGLDIRLRATSVEQTVSP